MVPVKREGGGQRTEWGKVNFLGKKNEGKGRGPQGDRGRGGWDGRARKKSRREEYSDRGTPG